MAVSNQTIDVILKRRSTRAFTSEPISDEVRTAIMDAALRSPTAGNTVMYSVIDVHSQAVKERLAVLCDNQPMIAKAPMVWVFIADTQKYLNFFDAYNIPARHPELENRKPGLGDAHLSLQDAIIAAQTAVIAAQSLGVGSCYIGDVIENWEEMKALLKLTDYAIPACMLIFGYPALKEDDKPLIPRCSRETVFMKDCYANPDKALLDASYAEMTSFYIEHKTMSPGMTIGERYYVRKYTSDFMKEMNRSAKEFFRPFE